MNRLGLLDPSELEGEAKDLYDVFHTYVAKYSDVCVLQSSSCL
jgi:hypothetical protein